MSNNASLTKCRELLEEVSKICEALDSPSATASPNGLSPTVSVGHNASSFLTSLSTMAAVNSFPLSRHRHLPLPTPSTSGTYPITSGAQPSTSGAQPNTSLPQTVSFQEHRRLFGFRSSSTTSRKRSGNLRGSTTTKKPNKEPTWTRTFVCLADKNAQRMPSSGEYLQTEKSFFG